jgi:hypothetical protein
MDVSLPKNQKYIRLHLTLLPEEASKCHLRWSDGSKLTIDALEALWDRARKKWGFSVVQEIMIENPGQVQLRISDVVAKKPAHRAGLQNGDIIYQLYECCTNPPLKLLFGMMCDSSAIE